MQQGTKEWLEFRRTRIGASDSPIIMGLSPWKTPYELWMEKTGRREPPGMTDNQAFGHQMEGRIRLEYEAQRGELFMPEVVTSSEFDWMIASLDGISGDRETIIEIKTCGAKVFAEALQGHVPDYYMIQVQHQLFCSKAKRCTMLFYNHSEQVKTGNGLAIVDVMPNENIQAETVHHSADFYYKNMLEDLSPPVSEKDYVPFEDCAEVKKAAKDWLDAHRCMQEAKKKKEAAEQILKDATDGGNSLGHGVKLSYVTRKGSVDYSKITELQDVDLDAYRKPSVTYSKISPAKEG